MEGTEREKEETVEGKLTNCCPGKKQGVEQTERERTDFLTRRTGCAASQEKEGKSAQL